MEVDQSSSQFLAAVQDFHQARHKAVIENIMGRFTGQSTELFSYEDVQEIIKGNEPQERGLQDIPLDSIVGSVGRYGDFTRSFLPRRKSDVRHWAEVKAAISAKGEIPPILVYKIDQAYFVLDGNHRVSVARHMGHSHIPAYVTEIETKVPLPPGLQPDELICRSRYAEFLEYTCLHERRPEADLTMTVPGQYRLLEEQIEWHRHWLSQEQGERVTYLEAVEDWYDEVYRPIIDIIRKQGVLRHFPRRTEADLFVWLSQHQTELKEALGWNVPAEAVSEELAARYSPSPYYRLARLKEKVLHLLIPEPLEAGPPPGQWREKQVPRHHHRHLFIDTLAALHVQGGQPSWPVVEQGLTIAQRERGQLHGLYMLESRADKKKAGPQKAAATFQRRCETTGVSGELVFETGKVTDTIIERARWIDLVIVNLVRPPGPHLSDRLSSPFGALLRRCPRPVLALPGHASPLNRALLAYDGSPKAKEALFVATYLAGQWQIPLVVVSVLDKKQVTTETLAGARDYLASRGVAATFVERRGKAAPQIIETAKTHDSNLIIMGSYGSRPVVEVMLGSAVDEVLRARRWPVLVCR